MESLLMGSLTFIHIGYRILSDWWNCSGHSETSWWFKKPSATKACQFWIHPMLKGEHDNKKIGRNSLPEERKFLVRILENLHTWVLLPQVFFKKIIAGKKPIPKKNKQPPSTTNVCPLERIPPQFTYPKNHWTLLWRGLTLYSRVLGSPNHQFWDPMILKVLKNQFDHVALDYTSEILPGSTTGPKTGPSKFAPWKMVFFGNDPASFWGFWGLFSRGVCLLFVSGWFLAKNQLEVENGALEDERPVSK